MITQVSVNGKQYNIAQAPAVKQRALLSLIGGKIALFKESSQTAEIGIPFLVGSLITCSEELLTQISDIVLYKTMLHGGKELITVENFQGSMNDYITLVAEGVRVNLGDFFDWLDRAGKEREELKKKPGKRKTR